MSSCCSTLRDQFDESVVRSELRRHERKGPRATTRALVDALVDAGIEGADLLDIGGGLGEVQVGLLSAGLDRAVSIEAAPAFVTAARDLATADGYADRIEYRVGDFIELTDDLGPVDVVTLDRVICCHPEMRVLVERSASRARRLYGVVYPRDTHLVRLGVWLTNALRAVRGNDFRTHVHPVDAIQQAIRGQGFRRRFHDSGLIWETAVYERSRP